MRLAHSAMIAAGALVAASSLVSAAELPVITTFSALPITAGAKTDDPDLTNRITNDMKVTIPTGQDWNASEIKITLTTGTVYNATNIFGGFAPVGTESSPNPSLWLQTGARNGEFDS